MSSQVSVTYLIKYIDEDGNEKLIEKIDPREIFMDFMMLCANGYRILETNIPGCAVFNL